MAETIETTGRIIDTGEFRSRKLNQAFFLVEDLKTTIKYPVYVSLDRSSSLGSGKFRKEEFQVGDIVRISGKMQKVMGLPLAGTKILEQSDYRSPGGGVFSLATLLVPKEMEKVQGAQ
jgi:hypothetical protein